MNFFWCIINALKTNNIWSSIMNKHASITGILIALVCAISSLPFLMTQSNRKRSLSALHAVIKMFKRENIYSDRASDDCGEDVTKIASCSPEEPSHDKTQQEIVTQETEQVVKVQKELSDTKTTENTFDNALVENENQEKLLLEGLDHLHTKEAEVVAKVDQKMQQEQDLINLLQIKKAKEQELQQVVDAVQNEEKLLRSGLSQLKLEEAKYVNTSQLCAQTAKDSENKKEELAQLEKYLTCLVRAHEAEEQALEQVIAVQNRTIVELESHTQLRNRKDEEERLQIQLRRLQAQETEYDNTFKLCDQTVKDSENKKEELAQREQDLIRLLQTKEKVQQVIAVQDSAIIALASHIEWWNKKDEEKPLLSRLIQLKSEETEYDNTFKLCDQMVKDSENKKEELAQQEKDLTCLIRAHETEEQTLQQGISVQDRAIVALESRIEQLQEKVEQLGKEEDRLQELIKKNRYDYVKHMRKTFTTAWLEADNKYDHSWIEEADRFKAWKIYLLLLDKHIVKDIIINTILPFYLRVISGTRTYAKLLRSLIKEEEIKLPCNRHYSCDNKYYIASSKTIDIYNSYTNQIIKSFDLYCHSPFSLFKTKNLLLFINKDKVISLYNIDSDTIYDLGVYTERGYSSSAYRIKINPKETRIVIADNNMLKVYDISCLKDTDKLQSKEVSFGDSPIEIIAMNHDGSLLAMVDESELLFVLSYEDNCYNKDVTMQLETANRIRGRRLIFSQDGKYILQELRYDRFGCYRNYWYRERAHCLKNANFEKVRVHRDNSMCTENANDRYDTVCLARFCSNKYQHYEDFYYITYDEHGTMQRQNIEFPNEERCFSRAKYSANMEYAFCTEHISCTAYEEGHRARSYLVNLAKNCKIKKIEGSYEARNFSQDNRLILVQKDGYGKGYSIITLKGKEVLSFPSLMNADNQQIPPSFDTKNNILTYGCVEYHLPTEKNIQERVGLSIPEYFMALNNNKSPGKPLTEYCKYRCEQKVEEAKKKRLLDCKRHEQKIQNIVNNLTNEENILRKRLNDLKKKEAEKKLLPSADTYLEIVQKRENLTELKTKETTTRQKIKRLQDIEKEKTAVYKACREKLEALPITIQQKKSKEYFYVKLMKKAFTKIWISADNKYDHSWIEEADRFKAWKIYLLLLDKHLVKDTIITTILPFYLRVISGTTMYTKLLRSLIIKVEPEIPLPCNRIHSCDDQYYIVPTSKKIDIYARNTNSVIKSFDLYSYNTFSLCNTKNLLLFINKDKIISLYNIDSGTIYNLGEYIEREKNFSSYSIQIHPEETRIVIADNNMLKVYDISCLNDNEILKSKDFVFSDNPIEIITMNHDGSLLAMVDSSGLLFLLSYQNDCYNKYATIQLETVNDIGYRQLIFSQDSKWIFQEIRYGRRQVKQNYLYIDSSGGLKNTQVYYMTIHSKNKGNTYSTVCVDRFCSAEGYTRNFYCMDCDEHGNITKQDIECPTRRPFMSTKFNADMKYVFCAEEVSYSDLEAGIRPASYMVNLEKKCKMKKIEGSNKAHYFSKDNFFVVVQKLNQKSCYSIITKNGKEVLRLPSLTESQDQEISHSFDRKNNTLRYGGVEYHLQTKNDIQERILLPIPKYLIALNNNKSPGSPLTEYCKSLIEVKSTI